jgi:hypothetical protein
MHCMVLFHVKNVEKDLIFQDSNGIKESKLRLIIICEHSLKHDYATAEAICHCIFMMI